MKKIGFKKNILTIALVLLFGLVLVACETVQSDETKVAEAVEALNIGFQSGDKADSVTGNVTLPSSVGEVTVTWATSNADAITATGVVKRSYSGNQEVKLTATLKLNDAQDTKVLDLVVVKLDDNVAPAFMGAVAGELPQIKHLETVEVDLLEGITARDNVDNYDVTITVDKKDYNKDVAGTYKITYTAEDKSGNKTNIDREIVVEPALDALVDAAVIGTDWVEYVYNDETAFKNAGTYGATFRQVDKLFVMDKAFYEAQLLANADDYPNNSGIPVFPYGSLIITDSDFNIIHARFQTGVFLQMDVVDGETVTTHTNVEWNSDTTGIAGGSMFHGVSALIPEGGYVMFASSPEPQKTRIFLVSNLFYTEYTGGAVTKDPQDIFELTDIELELKEDYRVLIPLPDKIATPELTLVRHTLSWDAIPNALNYTLFVDGEPYGQPLTTTTIDLSTLDIPLSEDDGYNITVVANTRDMFKYSSSDVSNEILYKKILIQTLQAPVVSVDAENKNLLTWSAVEGAAEYEVYFVLDKLHILVGKTQDTSFDIKDHKDFNGVNGYYVKGIGLITHSDSVASNTVYIDQTVTTTMVIGGMETEVVIMTAVDYFNRRNLTNSSKLGTYLYLVTDLDQVEAWSGINNEAFSTVVILDSNYTAKVVRNILPNQYTVEKGWHTDDVYKANGAQTIGFDAYVEDGDMLLIGKNALNITYVEGETSKVAAARDFVAYHYVNKWATFPTTPASGGWRDALTANFDSSTVEFELVSK